MSSGSAPERANDAAVTEDRAGGRRDNGAQRPTDGSREVERLAPHHRGVLGLQRLAGNRAVSKLIGDQGEPLGGPTRSRMEAAFGRDLGDVRLHSGHATDEAIQPLGAAALTVGSDIFMHRQVPRPDTPMGGLVLGEELAHVAQGVGTGDIGALSDPKGALEAEAHRASVDVARGRRAHVTPKPEAATVGGRFVLETAAVLGALGYAGYKLFLEEELKEEAKTGVGEAGKAAADKAAEEARKADEAQKEEANKRLDDEQRALLTSGVIGPLRNILGGVDSLPLPATMDALQTPFVALKGITGPEGAMEVLNSGHITLINANNSLAAANNPGGVKAAAVSSLSVQAATLTSIAKAARSASAPGPSPESTPDVSINMFEGYAERMTSLSARLAATSNEEETTSISDDVLAIGTAVLSIEAAPSLRSQIQLVSNRCILDSNTISAIAAGREGAIKSAKGQIQEAIGTLTPLASLEIPATGGI